MYDGDLLNPDRPAVWLQLQQASLSEETSIHLVHQGRKPTSHLAVWVILTTCHGASTHTPLVSESESKF
jgi:hypothetical protein